jgi:hypothetical protein
MKFNESLDDLYNIVEQSLLNEATIIMQGTDVNSELEEFNITDEMLNKIRRVLKPQAKNSANDLLTYLTTVKQISLPLAKRLVLYIEHYGSNPEKIISYILNEDEKLTLNEISGKSVNFISKLKERGFDDELIESLISLKEQGSGPGEFLFCITVKNLQKRAKGKKSNDGDEKEDGGDLQLIGDGGGKVELKGNSGILRSGKENTFGTPIDCSKFWRSELEKRLIKYGMTEELKELPDATAKPGGGKSTNFSFKLNNANRLTIDVFGKQIIQRLDEIKRKQLEFAQEVDYAKWLKSENIKLSTTEVNKEKFDLSDLVNVWAEGFHKLFIKGALSDLIKTVNEAYEDAEQGQPLGISLRNNLLKFNLDYYIQLDDFQYFVLFDHVPASKTYGKSVTLSREEMANMNKAEMLKLISIVSAPDFSRDVVSSGATSIKINSNIEAESE